MSLGPVMLDVQGLALTDEERARLRHPLVGGVILFTRNFASREQVAGLIRDIRALREPHLLIAVDQEGGRVQRFREGFTRLPPAQAFGQVYDRDPQAARHLAGQTGWLMAAELRAIGVDISFAPVLDIAHGLSGVIGDRAFHRDPEVVADLAHHFVQGMRRAGMAATGKHYPGHGGVREDSHAELPRDSRPFDAIREQDLIPFERMIHYGLPAVMTAHVVYAQVDAVPASFSRHWIQTVLRAELGFQGLVFSDDLSMAATQVMGGYGVRARKALEAGCDMVLVCNHPEGAVEVLQALAGHESPVSQVRMARMHGRGGMPWDALTASAEWRQGVEAVARLDPSPWLEMNV